MHDVLVQRSCIGLITVLEGRQGKDDLVLFDAVENTVAIFTHWCYAANQWRVAIAAGRQYEVAVAATVMIDGAGGLV